MGIHWILSPLQAEYRTGEASNQGSTTCEEKGMGKAFAGEADAAAGPTCARREALSDLADPAG